MATTPPRATEPDLLAPAAQAPVPEAAPSTSATTGRPHAGRFRRRFRGRVRRRVQSVAVPVGIVATVLATWEATVRARDISTYLLPAPSVILARAIEQRETLVSHLWTTLAEVISGFVLALATAFVVATVLAYSSTLRRSVMPLVVALKTIPIIAVAPLLIIWLGYNFVPRLLITALMCFFPMLVNTLDGLLSVHRDRDRLFRSLKASGWARFSKLAVPSALPHVFTGMKVAAPLCVIGATVSEWVGAQRGLGYLIYLDTGLLNTTRVFASLMLLSMIGITVYGAVLLLERLTMPWTRRPTSRRTQT